VTGILRSVLTSSLRACLLLAICAAPAAYADAGADATMRQLIEQVSTGLDQLHKQNRLDDRAAIEQLIRTDILPSVDQQQLARRVFRQYWAQLGKANRQAEAQERVINAVVRTYAAALASYSGDTINLVNVVDQGKRTVAKSRIRRPNGQTIQVDFSLSDASGKWLITDMAVDGIVVSLTLFNSMKAIWDTQGMDAALASVADVDVNQQKKQ
jgi:ABC-type transporter MlaC component